MSAETGCEQDFRRETKDLKIPIERQTSHEKKAPHCNYVTRSRLRHLDDTERTRHIDDIDGIPIVPLSTHNTDI